MSEVTRFVVLVFGTEAGGELTAWSSAGLRVGRHRPPNADAPGDYCRTAPVFLLVL
jgi:hypothetical protein